MSKGLKIGLIVVVVVMLLGGLAALRFGAAVYHLSDGERGWSVGAAVYDLLGWGEEAFQSDFSFSRRFATDAEDAPDDDALVSGAPARLFGRMSRGHIHGRLAVRGLLRLALLGGVIAAAVWVYKRSKKSAAPKSDA